MVIHLNKNGDMVACFSGNNIILDIFILLLLLNIILGIFKCLGMGIKKELDLTKSGAWPNK